MVELLEKAFAEVAKLPVDQQERFAQWILDRLDAGIIEELPHQRKSGTAEGKIQMSDDFDEPLDDFNEYTE